MKSVDTERQLTLEFSGNQEISEEQMECPLMTSHFYTNSYLFFGSFFHPSGRVQPQESTLRFFISKGFRRPITRATHETRHG